MKLILFIFLLKFIFFNKSLAFDSFAICLRNEIVDGHYDRYSNYKILRKYAECKGQWPVRCDKETCGSSQESCRLFMDLKGLSKPIGYAQFLKGKFIADRSFKGNIRNCQDTFILNQNDVCLNGQKCYQKTSVSTKFTFFSYIFYI